MNEMCLVMKGKSTGYGVQSIKMVTNWIFCCSHAKVKVPPSGFFKKLLKGLQYVPRVIITDELRSYGAAKREILPGVEHRQHKGLNNRAENSHQPTRQQEKQMRKFKSPQQAQRFLSAHGQVRNLFGDHRYKMAANDQRNNLAFAWSQWQDIVIYTECA